MLCSCLQEREFLKNYVQRIVDVRPNLVLVEKTVSRIAQDMLLEHGITLVINVKPVSISSQSDWALWWISVTSSCCKLLGESKEVVLFSPLTKSGLFSNSTSLPRRQDSQTYRITFPRLFTATLLCPHALSWL